MLHPKVSQRRAKTLSTSLFLIGLAIVSLTETWWPGMMLVVGIPLALRQYLLGHIYDACLSLAVFCGAFFVAGAGSTWEVVLPVLFIIAAIYILIQEFLNPALTTEAEDEESTSCEITEDEED